MSDQNVKAARLSIFSNITLIALKLVVGMAMQSVSVISEAVHSGIDLIAAIIAYFSVRESGKPADSEHRFGHGKIENVSATIEALLIFAAGIYIIIEALNKLRGGHFEIESLGIGAGVMAISAIVNWFVSSHLLKVAKSTDSVALEADALHLRIDANDLHLHRIADVQDLGWMVDTLPRHVGHVKQAIDAAEVNEGAVVGDVLHHAIDHLALFELGDDLGALLCARLFKDGAAGNDNIAAPAIHLQDLEGLRHVHERRHILDGPDVDLAAGQEGHGSVEIDGEAALDAIENDAFDLFARVELLLKLRPAILAASFFAAKNGLSSRILDPLDINLDLVANMEGRRLHRGTEFFERDAAFRFEAHINNGEIFFDGDDLALDDCAFAWRRSAHRLVEKSSKVVGGRIVLPGLGLYCLRCDH